MFRNKADRLLDEMIRENLSTDAEVGEGLEPERSWRGSFARSESAEPDLSLTPEQEAKRRDRRSDLTIAALGVTLGLICALFPWYIFFNPDEFGVRAMRFGGGGNGTAPIVLGATTDRIGAPAESTEVPFLDLDLRSTGSAVKDPDDHGSDEPLPGVDDQPFPPPVIAFKVIQIANGRAMLEDDTGLFVVQPGSVLPDGAQVKTIEERDGHPVLVTVAGSILEIAE
ncbi:MAG: hypothetical protein KF810_09775 [Rhizobiaceae bacterium]|nr:hypothetical protein [Rhizobiaceae bacterium]